MRAERALTGKGECKCPGTSLERNDSIPLLGSSESSNRTIYVTAEMITQRRQRGEAKSSEK